MNPRRRHRLLTTVFVVLALLFSRFALAQYVCPQEMDVQAMAERMEAGGSCAGMDMQQPALCHQHANDPGQTSEAPQLPVVSAPLIVQTLLLPLVPEHLVAPAATSLEPSRLRPPPDPLFLATRRLRV